MIDNVFVYHYISLMESQTSPPIPVSLRDKVRLLKPGDTFDLGPEFLRSLRTTAWAIAKETGGRYKVVMYERRARIWRRPE